MMNDHQVFSAVAHMRRFGVDTGKWAIESTVQSAFDDRSETLAETVCAFANADGGTILLGLSEKDGFRPAENFDAEAAAYKLLAIGEMLTPVVPLEIEQMIFEGKKIVVAHVAGLSTSRNPVTSLSAGCTRASMSARKRETDF